MNVLSSRQVLNGVLKGLRFCSNSVALVLVLSTFSASLLAQSVKTSPKSDQSVSQAAPQAVPGKLSPIQSQLAFESVTPQEKTGDAKLDDLFLAQGHGYTVGLGQRGAVVSLARGKELEKPGQLSLRLIGSNPETKVKPQSLLPGVSNYIPSSDPKTWRMGVERWSRVDYAEVYSGVDLSFYGNQQLLEYDFRLLPKADPSQIRMALEGAEKVWLDADGNLEFEIHGKNVRLLKPVSYQTSAAGQRVEVASEYHLEAMTGAGHDRQAWQVGFSLGAYDTSRELVIDPVFSYGLQPAYVDYTVSGITVDTAGNTYTTGQNQTKGFYVSKYNPAGTLVFNSVVGAGGVYAYPTGITIDSTGKVYVVGSAVPGLPTTTNAYQTLSPSTKTYYNAPFVAVFPAAGTAPTYLSYLGGTNGYDYSSGIALDSSNNIYITGYESSTTFPTTSSAYLKSYPGGTYAAFVAKINPTASGAASLVYSTLLGASTITSTGSAIAVDAAGDAYVTVQSNAGYPNTSGAYSYKGYISDAYTLGAFVTKVNPAGSALLYSAYIGPGAITGIAVDTNLDAYVTGSVYADDFPTTSGAYQTSYPGGFVSELNPAGSALVYSTFLSGPSGAYSPASNTVFPQSIAITKSCASVCAAYVSGYTNTADYPAVNAIESTPPTVTPNAFITEIAGNGAGALFSTYLTGVTGTVTSPFSTPLFPTPSVAVDGTGNMYFAANIGTADFPLTLAAATQIPYSYLAKISPAAGGFIVPYPKSLNFDSIDYSGESIGVSSTLSGLPVPLVLRNLGSSPVAISAITFNPATEFSETDTCAKTIPAGDSCTLNMAFTPTTKGVRTATMSVASNAAVSPVTVALSGTGVANGYLTVSNPTLTFPAANLGTASATQTITVTNIGKTLVNLQPSAVTGIRATWGTGTDFQVLSNCPAQILPAASCSIGVKFTPLASGTRAANFYLQGDGFGNQYITLYGSGISGTQGTISLSATVLNFNSQLTNTASARQNVTLTSTGTAPVSIYGVTIATTGQTGKSDFSIYTGNCVNTTAVVSVLPQATCYVSIVYTPTVTGAETGTLTFTDSATGTPHVVSLTGSGLAATQSLEFTPGNFVYPDQPIGVASTPNFFYVFNTGAAPVTIDRTLVTGDFSIYSSNCPGAIIKPNPAPGYEPSPGCTVRVSFTPTATGARTGSLTFVDTAGAPQVLSLSGMGVAATGGILLEPTTLVYPVQAMGTTSATQLLHIINAGNSPVNLTNIVSTGDYAIVDTCASGTFPYSLGAGRTCNVDVSFTPTKVATADAGTVVVSSSAGPATQTLTGSSVAATNAIGLTPTALNMGTGVTATQGSAYYLYVRNTGTEAITLTSLTLTGSNATDFSVSSGSCGFYSNLLAPGLSCYAALYFAPAAAGARSATLTLVDSVGTQTVAVTGTGAAALTGVQAAPVGLAFDQIPVGSVSTSPQYAYLHNYGTTTLSVSSAKISTGGSAFLIPVGTDTCTGKTVAASGYCYVQVQFAPSAAGYQTGTLTFTDSTSKAYPVTLAGFSQAVTTSSNLDPTSLAFPGQVLTTFSATQTVSLSNTSDIPMTVGALTGTNTIVGTATSGAFSTNGTQSASDGCSNQTVAAHSKCIVYISFKPTATGSTTGTLVFPVKYANNTTATYTLNLTGTGIAVKDAVELSPASITFQDQALTAQYGNGADSTQTITLWNTGNLPFVVGALTGTDTVINTTTTGDFSTSGTLGGYDGCTNQTVYNNSYCQVTVAFNPAAVGAKTGAIKFPVTYSDKTVGSATASLAGKGVAAASKVIVSPASGQFDVQVVGTTSDSSETLTFTMSNTGNLPVKVTTATITTPFSFVSDYCSGTTVAVNSNCQIVVAFSPTTATALTGTLTIPNSAGAAQVVHLAGTGILATKQISLSQTSIAFGNQVVATKSSPVVVLVSNQSAATVPVSSVVLGGTNKTDFIETDNCTGTSIYGHSYCSITVTFSPAAASTGARTATITETDTATGSPRVITLTGTGIAAAPAASLFPQSLSFGNQALSTKSTPLTFSVTNTGASALNITSVISSNATEFPLTTNGCTGKSIAAGANCLVSVTFGPNAGSTQTATITVTDNASPTTQTLTATGVSVGVPEAKLSATSVAFGNEGVSVVSAAKTITLTDSGTDTLHIASIAFTGTNASDFKQTNTCGTSIVASASCVISVTFDPAALGARTASLNITDNAGNVTGTIQAAALTGTGTGVAKIAFSPTSLTFASTNVGAKSAVSTITVSNPGTAALPITGVSIMPATNFTQTNTCGTSLAVGSTCVISVTFAPTVAGALTASVSVADGAAASPQTVSLSGTAVGVPAATLSATTIAFGNQAVTVASTSHTVTLTNTGSGSLVVASVKLSGTNATDFTETSTTCPGTLAPAAACTLSVSFKPAASGARAATLTITDNAGNVANSTQTVALTGTGSGTPQAKLSATSLVIPSTAVGSATGPQGIMLQNSGNGPLAIASIKMTGTDPKDFLEFDTCQPSVAAGATCEVEVYFLPSAPGTRTANLVITDNANNVANATQTVTLTGTATGAPQVSLSGTTLAFGTVKTATESNGLSVTLTNTGNATLTVSSVALGGTDAADYSVFNTCTSVTEGSSCVAVVFFKPAATGSRPATLTFTDNANNVAGAKQVITLTGTGN